MASIRPSNDPEVQPLLYSQHMLSLQEHQRRRTRPALRCGDGFSSTEIIHFHHLKPGEPRLRNWTWPSRMSHGGTKLTNALKTKQKRSLKQVNYQLMKTGLKQLSSRFFFFQSPWREKKNKQTAQNSVIFFFKNFLTKTHSTDSNNFFVWKKKTTPKQ